MNISTIAGANRRPASGMDPSIASFYHLDGGPAAGQPCRGTACFIARASAGGGVVPSASANGGEPGIHCLGQCFAAPAVAGAPVRPRVAAHCREPIVLARLLQGGARSLESYRAQGGYEALERALRTTPASLRESLERSELRGRGGAGFPVGLKWQDVARQSAPERVVIANADEGDPGAFIDRFILEDDPHAVIEGMAIAARAVGASRGWIYLRCEYPDALPILEHALAEARAAGWLGARAGGPDGGFEVQVHVGRGSYVCGEETALIASLEGRRPEVMARPPYVAERGWLGRPTLVNNVETLATLPAIIARGPDAYRSRGFSRSRGTKVMALNSLFRFPGLHEVEFGLSLRQLVEEVGGGLRPGSECRGIIVGGPLAGVIPPALFDTRLGFEELQAIGAAVGHGGVMAWDQHTGVRALLRQVVRFAADESCGKCTPCRLGSRRLEQLVAGPGLADGSGAGAGREITGILEASRLTSLCGHGTGLAEFAASVLRHYGKELESC